MEELILVTYATKYGSTAETAELIGNFLRDEGKVVEVRPICEVFAVTKYSAVIIGSPLYMGKLLPDIVEFVKKHQNMLHERPVIFFLAGYTLVDIDESKRKKALAAVDIVRPYVTPHETGLFAGKVPSENLSFMEKAAMKIDGISPGDYRNPDIVREWTKGLIDLRLLQF